MTTKPIRLEDDFFQDPHAVYRRLREEGPVAPAVTPWGRRIWLVTRYDEARALLADPRLSKDNKRAAELIGNQITASAQNAPGVSPLAGHMLNSDPPDHTRLRTLVNKAFTARTVARLRPRIEEITDALLDEVAAAGTVDLMEAFAAPLPTTVISELLGVPAEDSRVFRTWMSSLLSGASPEVFQRDATALMEFLNGLIADKRRTPGEDLLSELVHVSEQGDRLAETELVPMAFLLLLAGHETTVNLLGNSVLALMENPDQFAALRADLSLLPNAVEEFLRFEGPVDVATLRFTTEPVRAGDTEIPAGEFVMVALLSANRDAERFPVPDRLDIARQAGGHLAFGHGIHYCVGAPLARLEAEIALGKLLRRFDTIELDGEPALRWRASTLFRGLEKLPVRVS